jgi:hypothetical protein
MTVYIMTVYIMTVYIMTVHIVTVYIMTVYIKTVYIKTVYIMAVNMKLNRITIVEHLNYDNKCIKYMNHDTLRVSIVHLSVILPNAVAPPVSGIFE